MIITLIVAMSENRGIGLNGRIPWHLSADLKQFKRLTMGHHVLLGRKTFEAIGKILPGRKFIVVTRQRNYKSEGCLIAHGVDEAIKLANERGEKELFIAGGAEIYKQTLEAADRIYLTQVHTHIDADTFFPHFDESQWMITEERHHPADEKNEHPFTFKIFERRIDPRSE